MGSVLCLVRGRASFQFVCRDKGVGLSGGISIRIERRSIRFILERLFGGRKISCRVARGGLVLVGPSPRRLGFTNRGGSRAEGGIANIIESRGNRPVVKTGIMRGKAAGKAVASISNEFSLRMCSGKALLIDCVKFASHRLVVNGRDGVRVRLGRSVRTLSRIIMVNCKATGGGSLANTVARVHTRRVARTGDPGVNATLRKGVPISVNNI